MLGLSFWPIEICLILIMVIMTIRSECRQQERGAASTSPATSGELGADQFHPQPARTPGATA